MVQPGLICGELIARMLINQIISSYNILKSFFGAQDLQLHSQSTVANTGHLRLIREFVKRSRLTHSKQIWRHTGDPKKQKTTITDAINPSHATLLPLVCTVLVTL